ncbi:MAG TPA: hypothetical protein VJN64_13455 [Terriglobales bacterium]|nr:hypothetical protein [Terriglobales bacterium]
MTQRIDYRRVAPAAVQAMTGLQKYVDDCGLEASLLNLVKVRASQINGCAFASICTRWTLAPSEKPSSGCMQSRYRRRRHFSAIVNVPPWPGPKRLL